jgi:hypothetical protein
MMKMNKKAKYGILSCLEMIKVAVKQNDKDMLRSYMEQLCDVVAENTQEKN